MTGGAGDDAIPTPDAVGDLSIVGRLALTCLSGDAPGRSYRLDRLQMLIGRADEAEGVKPDIDLSEQEASQPRHWVSRRHAEITWTPQGCQVIDLKSTNKTFVNERELVPYEPVPLRAGDRMRIGAIEFLVEPAPDDR